MRHLLKHFRPSPALVVASTALFLALCGGAVAAGVYAVNSDKAHNSPDAFIANVDTICEAHWIKVTAEKNGTFTVVNTRDRFQKTYVKK